MFTHSVDSNKIRKPRKEATYNNGDVSITSGLTLATGVRIDTSAN